MDMRMVKLSNEYFLIDKSMLFSCQKFNVWLIITPEIKNPEEIFRVF